MQRMQSSLHQASLNAKDSKECWHSEYTRRCKFGAARAARLSAVQRAVTWRRGRHLRCINNERAGTQSRLILIQSASYIVFQDVLKCPRQTPWTPRPRSARKAIRWVLKSRISRDIRRRREPQFARIAVGTAARLLDSARRFVLCCARFAQTCIGTRAYLAWNYATKDIKSDARRFN